MSSSESAATRRGLAPGIALVLATVVISGISNFVNFRAVQGTNVDAWIAVRNAVVALLVLPLAVGLRSRSLGTLSRGDWLRLAVIGFVGGAVPFLLYFHGFQLALGQGGAAAASFGYRCLFLMASVLGIVFLRERLSRRFVVAAGALLAGNVLLLSLTGPVWTDGTAYVLLATAMWAGEYTISKRALNTLPSSTVALGRMGFGALFLLVFVGLSGQAPALLGFGGADWMNLFLSALLLFAFVTTWYAGLRSVDLSVASALLVLAFPITWLLGILVSRNAFTLEQGFGAAAIVLGAGLVAGLSVLRRGWGSARRWLNARLPGAG